MNLPRVRVKKAVSSHTTERTVQVSQRKMPVISFAVVLYLQLISLLGTYASNSPLKRDSSELNTPSAKRNCPNSLEQQNIFNHSETAAFHPLAESHSSAAYRPQLMESYFSAIPYSSLGTYHYPTANPYLSEEYHYPTAPYPFYAPPAYPHNSLGASNYSSIPRSQYELPYYSTVPRSSWEATKHAPNIEKLPNQQAANLNDLIARGKLHRPWEDESTQLEQIEPAPQPDQFKEIEKEIDNYEIPLARLYPSKSKRIQKTGSNSEPVSNEQFHSSSESDTFIFQFGTLSRRKEKLKERKFQTSALSFGLHFGTDELKNMFYFKYFINSVRDVYQTRRFMKEEINQRIFDKIESMFQALPLSNYHSIPYYHVFSGGHSRKSRTHLCLRIPFYFFFTSISQLIQAKENGSAHLTKDLRKNLKQVYLKMLGERYFLSLDWKFLVDKLVELEVIGKNETYSSKKIPYRYDIHSVSFIYNEYKQNKVTQDFFSKVWNACKRNCTFGISSIPLSIIPLLEIPEQKEPKANSFHLAARKLYQFKFTDLLIKRKWSTIEELLVEYSELKEDFKKIATDFRLRVFSKRDFESLEKVLKVIEMELKNNIPADRLTLYEFVFELEYFVLFKCSLYFFDLYNEFEKENLDEYFKILETFKAIEKYFSKIRLMVSNYESNIKKKEKANGKEKNSLISNILPFSLSQINVEMDAYLSSFEESSANFGNPPPELALVMENLDYLKQPLPHLPDKLTRFGCAEFITKLDEWLEKNDEEVIEKLFSERESSKYTMLWTYIPTKRDEFDYQSKKEYLRNFKKFLVLHNQ